jgi:hypothetical protein
MKGCQFGSGASGDGEDKLLDGAAMMHLQIIGVVSRALATVISPE